MTMSEREPQNDSPALAIGPTPWRSQESRGGLAPIIAGIYDAEGTAIAYIASRANPAEAAGHLRLMRSAPKLEAALEDVESTLSHLRDWAAAGDRHGDKAVRSVAEGALGRVRTAIAEAKGGAS